MRRALNLRQIEIFKALMEVGTISRAAEALNISQPAASKLLMNLESDIGIKLFDRQKGRLLPREQSMRLYEEVERIFAGVRQVETAIDYIKREDQGRLVAGIPPSLAGSFIKRTTMNFLAKNPNVYCVIQSNRLRWTAEYVLSRQIDVGLSPGRIDNENFVNEPVIKHNLTCIMPVGHPFAELKAIRPEHLNDAPFLSFHRDSYTGHLISGVFDRYNVRPNTVLATDAAPAICEFVAAGLGVALVSPLFLADIGNRVIARPFEPETPMDLYLSFPKDARNMELIRDFADEVKATAGHFMQRSKIELRE